MIYVFAAALPNVLWTQYLRWLSHGAMTKHLRTAFVEPVVNAWLGFARDPLANILLPFAASHVGVHVAFHQMIAMVYWPLLFLTAGLLIWLRPRITSEKRHLLVLLLPLFLFLEQMAAAGWDWELNPRRALPVVLSVGFGYCYCVDRLWSSRTWRALFIAMLVMSATLAMSDTLFRNPVLAFMRTGQAMHEHPNEAVKRSYQRLDNESMPKLMHDDPNIIWKDMGRARITRDRIPLFVVTQGFLLSLLVSLFWLTARARILPRWAPYAAAAVWFASLARVL